MSIPRHWTVCALLLASLAVLTPCPASGQGVGVPSSTGFVPRLDLEHRQVGVPNALWMSRWAAGTPVTLFAGTVVAPMPLASFGLDPAVFAPSLAPTGGTMVLSGLMADAQGRVALSLTAPPALAGQALCFQAVGLDALAPYGGVAVSEARSFAFGVDLHPLAVAVQSGEGDDEFALVERFSDGQAASAAPPGLAEIDFEEVTVASTAEMARARDDVPGADPFHWIEQIVELPDGSAVVRLEDGNDSCRFVRVTREARMDLLLTGDPAAPELDLKDRVAVSAHDPYVAVVSEDARPEFGGARLILIRVDGDSFPGSHRFAEGIATPGLLIAPSSLCFLDGALFFGDGASELRRLDLATFAVSSVVFPPSGGVAPAYVDGAAVPAANGSVLAIGAGASMLTHDIYAVDAAGVAINVTDDPGLYHDPALGQADGIKMAVDPTGQRVAYVKTTYEPQVFARTMSPPFLQTDVTTPAQLIAYIDTVVGVGFATVNKLVYTIGDTVTTTDAFLAEIPAGGGPVQQFENLTQSSLSTAPPYDYGQLQLERFYTAGDVTFLEMSWPDGSRLLQTVTNEGEGQTRPLGAVEAVVPMTGATLIADLDASGSLRARLFGNVGSSEVIGTWSSAPMGELEAFGTSPSGDTTALVVESAAGNELVIFDATGAVTTVATPAGEIEGSLSIDGQGRVVVPWKDDPGGTVRRYDPVTGQWSTLWSSSSAIWLIR